MQSPFTVSDKWGRFVIELWSIGENPKNFETAFNKVKQEGYDEELVMWFYNELNADYESYCIREIDKVMDGAPWSFPYD